MDTAVDTVGISSTNGGSEPLGLEPKTTVIARDDVLSGKLQVKGGGQVLGSFSGNIECDGDLLIGPEAHVEADIRSARVTVAGFVRGNVVAVNRLKIMSTGRLEGDARVGALVVQEGGVHHGVIRVHPEGVPESEPEPEAVPAVRPGIVSVTAASPSTVGKVRKFWGEFF
ncbi:MAG TPA: polymer-forming cytoskeletal protein [Thermoanaerobaculia bacterium]|jgi:cytoskeletal protein CcmA (bactofilin family)|nr:polymer-forming cytoskeletal protein [Thermoanaerobaculia bacterium]